MFIIEQTGLAIGVCLLAMLCWGSWSNGQKIAARDKVPITLFYRDYVLGIVLWAVVAAFTLGSLGEDGRPFLEDLRKADWAMLGLALAAGVAFNLGNQLLVAGIQAAGLAIGMPVGTSIALVLGLIVNYLAEPEGNVALLAAGGAVVLVSIACSAFAYLKKEADSQDGEDDAEGSKTKGLLIAGSAGLANGFFFWMITTSMASDFADPERGQLTPYTALVVFAVGMAVSNPLFEHILRRFADTPEAAQLRYRDVTTRHHWVGVGSGLLWGLGMTSLLLASTEAGNAISFGISQGATVVGVLWGLFAWREFKGAPTTASRWLWAMGGTYVLGVGLIVAARLGS